MKVTIVGTGYVGLVTGACLTQLGHQVVCVDTDTRRVERIARGEPPFHEPGLPELLRAGLDAGSFAITSAIDEAMDGSALSILAVGTPPRGEQIDLTAITAAAGDVGRTIRKTGGYHVVTVKSTVVPGTTENVVGKAVAAASGMRIGEFGLCMNPEFLREGTAVDDFMRPDRIVIGASDARAAAVLAELYRGFDCPKLVTSLHNAELIKYASNALLATMVSFSNEIAALCESVPGLDEETVMSGVHLDRRWQMGGPGGPGILTYLRAGIGFGGSCLPKDVDALRTFASERRVPTPFLDAVVNVNRGRPGRVTALLDAALGGLGGRRVAVFGLAFKPGTDDLRDSPAIALIRALGDAGAAVRAWDPMIRSVDGLTVAATAEAALAEVDAAVIATAWPELATLDWRALTRPMRLRIILDGRGALRGVDVPDDVTVLRIGVGREP
jgi:UDPglucose 6-dehydrogenase/GDP-mannose 6-dehydrogenase